MYILFTCLLNVLIETLSFNNDAFSLNSLEPTNLIVPFPTSDLGKGRINLLILCSSIISDSSCLCEK